MSLLVTFVDAKVNTLKIDTHSLGTGSMSNWKNGYLYERESHSPFLVLVGYTKY